MLFIYAGTNTWTYVGRAPKVGALGDAAIAEAMGRYIAPCNICIYAIPGENGNEQYLYRIHLTLDKIKPRQSGALKLA